MFGACVDLELRHLLTTERALGHHATNRATNRIGGLAVEHVGIRLAGDTARITRVPVDLLLRSLVAAHDDLVGVDDHDVVAGVDMRREGRLVLAAQQTGDLGAEAAEDDAIGVDHVPLTLDLTCFRGVRLHRNSISHLLRDTSRGQAARSNRLQMNRVMIRVDDHSRQRATQRHRENSDEPATTGRGAERFRRVDSCRVPGQPASSGVDSASQRRPS